MTYPPRAVNVLLEARGLTTVNRVDLANPDSAKAVSLLEEVDEHLQEHGYWFNTEYEYVLNKNDDNEVLIPSNALNIYWDDNKYVQRGNRVYDRVAHSFKHTADIKVPKIILQQAYDDCPRVYQQALKARAAQHYFAREDGEPTVLAALKEDADMKHFRLKQQSLAQQNVSALNSPAAMRLTSGMRPNPLAWQFSTDVGGTQWRAGL